MPKLTDTELTRLATEKVMGWKVVPWDWTPRTDWRAAGEIVEKMLADGWFPSVESGPRLTDGKWERVVLVRWGKDKQFGKYTSANFPTAITVSALLAVGAITEEQV